MTEVADARIKIGTDGASEAQKALGAVTGALSALGAAALAVAGAGLAALGAGLKFALEEAIEAQEVMAQLNAVLKSTGGSAGITSEMASDLADALSKVTKFSDEAALAAETMLLRFDNIGQEIFPQALEAAADLATAMGTDLTAAAQTVGKALDDPANGIGRLNTALKLFTPEQEAAIKAMAEAGDVAGAQAAILEGLSKSVGGAAIAAGQTAAGQFEIFKNKLSNVAEEIGMKLLPVLGQLGEIFFPMILELANQLIPVFDQLAQSMGFFVGMLQSGVDPLTVLSAAFPQMAPAIQNLGESLKTIGMQLTAFWQQHGDAITAFVVDGLGRVVAVLSATLQFIAGVVAAVTAAMNGNWSTAMAALENGASGALDTIAGIFNSSGAEIAATWQGVGTQIGIIADAIKTKIISSVENAITGAINTAKTAVKIGKAMIDGIVGAITSGAADIVGALVSAVLAAVAAAQSELVAHSPSEVTEDLLGHPIGEGIVVGLNKEATNMSTALVRGINRAMKVAANVVSHNVNAQRNSYNSQDIGFYGPINQQFSGDGQTADAWLQDMADLAATA